MLENKQVRRSFFSVLFMPYNKSFIDQASSVKMAGYWPRSLFTFLWTSTSSRSIKTQKENSANIQPSWPRTWSIIYTYWPFGNLSVFIQGLWLTGKDPEFICLTIALSVNSLIYKPHDHVAPPPPPPQISIIIFTQLREKCETNQCLQVFKNENASSISANKIAGISHIVA